jgi:DNA-binding transcriptional ArsR family regulator
MVPFKGTIVPIMGINNEPKISRLASALFSGTRLSILSLLFINDNESFYLREIMRILGKGRGSVQRELANLTDAGLILRSERGNQVFYQANKDSPVFSELKTLLVKTAGIADVVRASLSDLEDKIRVAFIYGSFADGTDTAESDVDVFLIGDISLREVVSRLQDAQATIGREINPATYSTGEFREKLQAGHHFVSSIYGTSKIFLIGNEDELKGLAEKEMVD